MRDHGSGKITLLYLQRGNLSECTATSRSYLLIFLTELDYHRFCRYGSDTALRYLTYLDLAAHAENAYEFLC